MSHPRSSLRPVSSSHPAASGASGVPKPHQRPAQLYPTPADGDDFVPTPCVNIPGNATSQAVIDPIYTNLVVVNGQTSGSDTMMRSSLTGVMVVLPGAGREIKPRRAKVNNGTPVTDPASALIEPMPVDGAEQDAAAAEPPDYAAGTSGRTTALRPDFDGQGLRIAVAADEMAVPPISAEYAGKEEVKVRNDTLGMIFVRTSPSNGVTWSIRPRQSLTFSHGHTGWAAGHQH